MLNVRKAKLSDIPKIAKLDDFGRQLNYYMAMDRLDPGYKRHISNIRYVTKYVTGKGRCLVAEQGGKIIGFILFETKEREKYWKIKRVGYIDLVFINKNSRGRKIGRMLFEEAIKTFKKDKLNYAALSVQSMNKEAKRIWQHLGFRTHREEMFRRI
jgi:ribosomal protein S18 acetylase RimI-like enzyme